MDVVYEPVADHQDLTTFSLRPRCVHQVLDRTLPRFSYAHTASYKTSLRSYHVLAVPNTSSVGSYHVHARFLSRPPRFINFVLTDFFPSSILKCYMICNKKKVLS